MSSRSRQSIARPTLSRLSAAGTPDPSGLRRPVATSSDHDELPPYRKPTHVLTDDAQTKLRALNDRSIVQLREYSRKAGDRITEAAGLVLDVLHERQETIAKERKLWETGVDTDVREREEAELVSLQEAVDGYTKKLEERMRATIDNDKAAQRIEEALKWLRDHAPGQLERDYASQRIQSQSQGASQSHMESTLETQESAGPTPGPTPLDGSRPSLTGVSEMYAERIEQSRNKYTSVSFSGRYARNEAYGNFKKMVHDAKYRDDRPLPHPDTWFNETGSPAPGVTGHGADHDQDDDIVMERATISIKCPLTFLPFKDPYTSSKCPHTFERTAILELIRKSATRLGGGSSRGGERAVICPVTGCDQVRICLVQAWYWARRLTLCKMLTAGDLHPDPILVRKIKRMQQEKAREAEESETEDVEEFDVSQQEPGRSQPRIKGSPSSRA